VVLRKKKNDSAIVGVGGSLTLMRSEHSSVRMVREQITMTLEPKDYEVTVDFVFTNDGAATVALMGFPESGSGDVPSSPKKSGMKEFTTWVDGVRTKTVWTPVKSDNNETYLAHWVKEVRFGAGQSRKIRVRYRSDYGGSATNGLRHFVSYDFTGANWKGTVDESALTVVFKRPGSFIAAGTIRPAGGETGPVAFAQKGASLSKVWKDWEAQADFTMAFGSAPATWRTTVAPGDMESTEEMIPGSVILPAAKTRTVTVAGPPPTSYDWCPPVFTATGGVPMIAVRHLSWLAETKLTPEAPTRDVKVTFGTHTGIFRLGDRVATLDGKKVTLAAAPRLLKEILSDSGVLYVPLMPFASLIGLKLELQPGDHLARVSQ
jgi:hypothetical protein